MTYKSASFEIRSGHNLIGKAEVGDFMFVDARAVVLPGIKNVAHCIVSAGTVVTKHLSSNIKVKGVPAK